MRALLQPNMRFIGLVARWAVVAILVGSALLKLSFLASGAPAVPSGRSAVAYAGVALLELVFAGLFLTRWARGVALLFAAGLLGAASVTTWFGLTGPAGLACHCLGETKLQLGQSLALQGLLLLLTVIWFGSAERERVAG